jgi:starch synthase
LKYGTLPIVRSTGGLNDTVLKYDTLTKKGNGFLFSDYDSNQLKETIIQAYELFVNNKEDWNKLIQRAMKEDNSIKKSSAQYIDLYQAIMEK